MKNLDPDIIFDWQRPVSVARFQLFTENVSLLFTQVQVGVWSIPLLQSRSICYGCLQHYPLQCYPRNLYLWPILGSKLSNEEMTVLCLCSFDFVIVILLSYPSNIGNKEKNICITSICWWQWRIMPINLDYHFITSFSQQWILTC